MSFFVYVRWAVLHNKNLPETPSFLCTTCLLQFCYKDGKKDGDFKLFPLKDLSAMY